MDLKEKRIKSIDILRGQVMILMALDHVRDFFHLGSFFRDPLNLSSTTPALFMTRWLTHFCAPVFVFLAGISSFLFVQKTGDNKKSFIFIFSRGIFLILLELTVINFAWTFDIGFSFQLLQVIWAIGFSMVFLSFAMFLPNKVILIIGIIIVSGHNIFDTISFNGKDLVSLLWYFLHQSQSVQLNSGKMISFSYPILPWIGILFIGYGLGFLFSNKTNNEKRIRTLLIMGIASCLVFLSLRYFNLYGDHSNWFKSSDFLKSIFSFINTTKYPPSLLFTLMTLGPAMILLSIYENHKSPINTVFITFGRVPLFFYIVHLYLTHLAALVILSISGGNWKDLILTDAVFRTASLYNYGYSLPIVYFVWLLLILSLYPLCKIYGSYKEAHKGNLWLKYF